jgi:RNA polymerase sigma-70 factor, ECF subfamily
MKEPDPQTIAAARGGDSSAFETLVRTYQPDVWRLAIYLVRDESAAEDVVQEAFIRAFRFLPRFRGESKFSTWLFSITRNCAHDSIRASVRRRRMTQLITALPLPSSADPTVPLDIKDAISGLEPELREPLVLVDVFEMSYAEAARILDVPQGTIKSRVHRARQSLIGTLGDFKEAGHEA